MYKSLDEKLKRMKYLSQINEAKYNIVDNLEEDDEVPNDVWSEEPTPDTPEAEEPTASAPEVPATNSPEMPMQEPVKPQEEVQNDILRLNVSALEKMQGVIDNIDASIAALNSKYEQITSKMEELNADVEEVREPTNVEKLMRRKEDSHPFYYNLNNMWKGASFQARLDQVGENGIIKQEDGTYIADFNDLLRNNDREIKDSFLEY